jgi:hypothetical protein
MSHRGHPRPGNSNAPVTVTSPISWNTSQPVSRTSSRNASREPISNGLSKHSHAALKSLPLEEEGLSDDGSDLDEMGDRRPPLHRPTDGRSHQPLLHKDDDLQRGRPGFPSPTSSERPPLFTRRSTMRSRSPDSQAKFATRKKYTYAAFFLGLSLVSFVIQTETAVYIQHKLEWNKAYCML